MKLHLHILGMMALAATLLVAACTKDDVSLPTVSVTAPLDSSAYDVNDTITVTGTVTDDVALKEAIIEITTTADSVVYTKTIAISGTSVVVTGSYIVNIPSASNIIVEVTATDASENHYAEQVRVHIN